MALYSERVALVTGSSRGVGRLIAEHFLKQGATVIGVSRGGSDLTHEAYRHCQADVSDAAAVQALFGGLRAQGISVDIVVNNAAVLTSQYAMILPASAAQAMVNINLMGPFLVSREAAKMMRKGKWGRIINIGSRASQHASLAGVQAYTAAKHAIAGLTRQLAADLGPSGITVNCVAPALVRTNPQRDAQWDRYGEAGQQALLNRIALRRLGTADDIAHAVGFLASDLASYVTGVILPVDGGVS